MRPTKRSICTNVKTITLRLLTALAVGTSFATGWLGARSFDKATAAAHGGPAVPAPAPSGLSHGPDASASTPELSEVLAQVAKGTGDRSEDYGMAAAILRMTAADFPGNTDALLEFFSKNNESSSSRNSALAEAWMTRWLELDAPAALRFLETSPFLSKLPGLELQGWPLQERSQCSYGGVFTALARHQPGWLRKYLAELPEEETREVGMYTLARELAHRDVTQARQFLNEIPAGKERSAMATGLVAELAKQDAFAAFEIAKAEATPWLKYQQMRLVFSEAGSRSLAEAKALLERFEKPEERADWALEALNAAAYESREDTFPFLKEEAARLAEKLGEKANFERWPSYLSMNLGGPQTPAFAEWALNFAPDKEAHLFRKLGERWARESPQEFAAWVNEHSGHFDAAQTARVGAAIAALSNYPEAMRDVAEVLPAGPLRDQARFQLALDAGRNGDFAQAAEAYRAVAPTDKSGAFAAGVASGMATKNRAAAAEWAMQLPEGKARAEALRVVAQVWSQRDVKGAAAWLEAMPAGGERDRAMKIYATTVVVSDADVAAQWAMQVADPVLRQQTAETVYEGWRIQDPIAARAWLRELPGISESARGRILRMSR
jgi:hypothetical protein